MTLIEQFPDVSMLMRDKKKQEANNKASPIKTGYNSMITSEQRYYDQEFRNWHYKLLFGIGLILTGLYFLVLNGRTIINWLSF
jgi:hypothetical protein